jgi:hypothetical protein
MEMEAIIKEQVDKCTHNLLKMGQQLCSNIFSENIYYITLNPQTKNKWISYSAKKGYTHFPDDIVSLLTD